MSKRVFLIVLDSFGIGEMPDAKFYMDEGSNTLKSVVSQKEFNAPFLKKMGLFNIEGTVEDGCDSPVASFARLKELSKGKDTTTGHWEMAGIVLDSPFPTYPNGFPSEIIDEIEKQTGRKVICNKPYSGTQVINDYGDEHIKTGALIVYTSADSVLQIAAHEEYVPVEELYRYCEIARKIMSGKHACGRIIARPFIGNSGNYVRTKNRHDFSLKPTKRTMLDELKDNNFDVISVGKINDIFSKEGITKAIASKSNEEGMDKTIELLDEDFTGLVFTNLVDFDMLYGHRNDAKGYAQAISIFDEKLNTFLKKMKKEDILIITADHGCDPLTESTDHSREYVPMLVCGDTIKKGVDLKTIDGFNCIAKFILRVFNIKSDIEGYDFYDEVTCDK